MLCVNAYPLDYIATCRAGVEAQLASFRQMMAKPAKSTAPAFESQFFNHMLLALDHYFMHRARAAEGKDGNPLNEVRMLCNAIMENGAVLQADKTIKYKPENTVLHIAIGDKVKLDAEGFTRLAHAFFDEIKKKFS